jgi:hypothetical protein
MVIIDAEKHKLNYKQSYIDNGIANLKRRYQGTSSPDSSRLAGASTIISRSGNATIQVPRRVARKAAEGGKINPETGEKVFVPTGETRVQRTGIDVHSGKRVVIKRGIEVVPGTIKEKTVVLTQPSKPLLEVKDAHELVSKDGGTPIEHIYADHANRMRALANEARKEQYVTKGLVYNSSAAKTYHAEVKRLNEALNVAKQNSPRERIAQLLGNSMYRAILESNPHMDDADKKKERGRALKRARDRVGAGKTKIIISDDEWRAIQAGAISGNRLSEILDNTNLDRVKELATPRNALVMTPSKVARAQLLLDNGYTQAEVASALGVPVSTLNSALVRKVANE